MHAERWYIFFLVGCRKKGNYLNLMLWSFFSLVKGVRLWESSNFAAKRILKQNGPRHFYSNSNMLSLFWGSLSPAVFTSKHCGRRKDLMIPIDMMAWSFFEGCGGGGSGGQSFTIPSCNIHSYVIWCMHAFFHTLDATSYLNLLLPQPINQNTVDSVNH